MLNPSKINGLPLCPDAACLAIEAQATPEDIICRESAARDDLTCFITYMSLEDNAVLGLGLYVHPLSARQKRYGLTPDFDLVFDYLEVDAFNRGVQHANLNQSENAELPCMVSSARKRLNGWLPLYVNAKHWALARPFVNSAFSSLATGKFESCYRTHHALNVCCNLLACIASGFTAGQTEYASPRTSGRGKVSEKALQMYADVHRLFLQVALECPEVRQLALQRLRAFIQDPIARTSRDQTPSIGGLVQCLLITEELSWEDLAPTFIPEVMRRHAVRQASAGVTLDLSCCRGAVDKLISEWDKFAPQAASVTCFSVIFYRCVGRPNGCLLKEVAAVYDQRWGRLQPQVVHDLMDACSHLATHHSIEDIIAELLPHGSCSRNKLGDILLWAERHGRPGNRGMIPESEWPQIQGPNRFLCQWQQRQHRQRARQSSWCNSVQLQLQNNESSQYQQFLWLDRPHTVHVQNAYIQDCQYHQWTAGHHLYCTGVYWSWNPLQVASR